MIGKLLNERYKIKKQIGSGGMALVYEAQDILLDRKVAIKMLRPEFVSDEDFINKFRHEAKAVARITHPNVVSIYDIVESEDSLYLVMEYIEGKDLKTVIKERGKLSIVEALDIANQVTAGVEVAHNNNIIHCDIKPHNILLTENNQIKVTDFGIARAVTTSTMTITDTIMGSAHYFSPEQAQGKEINTYSDIYSIGVVLYEMISGRVPFKGDSPISVALKHIQNEPEELKKVLPSVPDQVNDLVMKSLSKDPKDRFSNASELREELVNTLKNIDTTEEFNEEEYQAGVNDTKVLKKSEIKKKGLENQKEKNKKTEKEKDDSESNGKSYFSPDTKNTSKLNRWVVWLLVIVLLASASVFGLVYFFKVYTEVPIIEVPNLINTEFEKAKDIVSEHGLSLKKAEEEVFHNEVERGHIVTQEPRASERVKQTRQIVVTISKGPKIIEVPDFKGRPLREVEVLLDNLGLQVEEFKYEFSEQFDENYVVSQVPEPGSEIEVNTKVQLGVSKGPKPIMVTMPSLLGKEKDEAFNLITRNGLEVGKLNYGKSTRYDEGLVMNQEYQAGENVPENSTVDVGISTGLVNQGNFEEHRTNIGINIVGSNEQEIKIVVKDSNGEEIAYQRNHSPGEYVNKIIYSVGPTVLEIYRDGELIKTQEIGT